MTEEAKDREEKTFLRIVSRSISLAIHSETASFAGGRNQAQGKSKHCCDASSLGDVSGYAAIKHRRPREHGEGGTALRGKRQKKKKKGAISAPHRQGR